MGYSKSMQSLNYQSNLSCLGPGELREGDGDRGEADGEERRLSELNVFRLCQTINAM